MSLNLTTAQKKKLFTIAVCVAIILVSYILSALGIIDIEYINNDPSSLRVHYIDVGQGDSIFIELPNEKTALIDAGTNSSEETVINYISSCGYEYIDYVIATHPHEDHIGGMDGVLNTFKVGEFYLPDDASTTRTFENMLEALEKNGASVIEAKAGVDIINDEDVYFTILSPIIEYADEYGDDHNAWSVICRLTYGENSFIFTGDAEAESESLLRGNLQSNVLKAGHHGSSTSTSIEFFNRVNPEIAIISCGADNDYGHPHRETIRLFNDTDTEYYRTDISGTVVVSSNGYELKVETEK